MTNNINITPNRLCIHGDTRVSHYFGELHSCRPVLGHDAIRAEWDGRMGMELTRAAATDVVRQFTEALASTTWPDCSAIAADVDLEGQGHIA
jgi:hypothetical protein